MLDLWDWRRRVADLYAGIRAEPDPQAAWHHWRRVRDALFRDHPQSPIEPGLLATFTGVACFDYDPAFRFVADTTPIEADDILFDAGGDGAVPMRPFARTAGLAPALGRELTLYWIRLYGGGVFLPFADSTSGETTYGAGRYLLDTIKSADLGVTPDGRVVLDFNFAYNPSCSYSDRYVCPLPPPENRLPVAVKAGERTG